MRRALPAVLAAAVFAGLATPAFTATTREIKVGDDYFVREGKAPTVTVKAQTRVRWRWVGDSAHNVTVSKGPVRFRSKSMTTGTYSKVVTRKGTYKIYCTIHSASVQSMTLRVQ